MIRYRFRIVVSGQLREAGHQAFEDFTIEPNGTTTTLEAALDQAALYGAIHRIQSLGLELIEVTRLPEASTSSE